MHRDGSAGGLRWPPTPWSGTCRRRTGDGAVGTLRGLRPGGARRRSLCAPTAARVVIAMLAGAAVMLFLIAFAGGAGLLASHNRYAKGLGLGLMIGWALLSLFSVGFCTGVNPAMYASS